MSVSTSTYMNIFRKRWRINEWKKHERKGNEKSEKSEKILHKLNFYVGDETHNGVRAFAHRAWIFIDFIIRRRILFAKQFDGALSLCVCALTLFFSFSLVCLFELKFAMEAQMKNTSASINSTIQGAKESKHLCTVHASHSTQTKDVFIVKAKNFSPICHIAI